MLFQYIDVTYNQLKWFTSLWNLPEQYKRINAKNIDHAIKHQKVSLRHDYVNTEKGKKTKREREYRRALLLGFLHPMLLYRALPLRNIILFCTYILRYLCNRNMIVAFIALTDRDFILSILPLISGYYNLL